MPPRPVRLRKRSRLELLLWTLPVLVMTIPAFALPLARWLPTRGVVGWAAGAAAGVGQSTRSRAQHRLLRAAGAAVGDGMEEGEDGGSPVQQISMWGREAFVKRDDKLDLLHAGVHGNKARKLFSLAQRGLEGRLPPLIVSHGGVQSNALAALAGLVGPAGGRLPCARFLYFCKPVPSWLRRRPLGTYARAAALGVEFCELPPATYASIFGEEEDEAEELVPPGDVVRRLRSQGLLTAALLGEEKEEEGLLFIPQGGAFPGASAGVRALGEEIRSWWRSHIGRSASAASLAVVLPAGTGTTALGLARTLVSTSYPAAGGGRGGDEDSIVVYAIPCVGSGAYLRAQMRRLAKLEGGGEEEGPFPVVLEGSAPHVFARPEKELLDVWRALRQEADMTLDLIYGPQAWRVMRERCWSGPPTTTAADGQSQDSGDGNDPAWFFPAHANEGSMEERTRHTHTHLLYVHTGGLEGLASQLGRYRRLGLLTEEEEEEWLGPGEGV